MSIGRSLPEGIGSQEGEAEKFSVKDVTYFIIIKEGF